MARKARATGSSLTPKQWSKQFLKYALEENVLARMGLIGSDPSSCIQIRSDLTKSKGETVQFQMDAPLTGVGGGDDYNSEDIMEAYDNYYQDVTIHERGHTTGISGPATKNRLLENWDERATFKLAEWKGIVMEKEIIHALSGMYNLSTSVESINEVEPSNSRQVIGGENSSGTLGSKTDTPAGDVIGSAGGLTNHALLTAETATNYLFGPRTLEAVMAFWLDQEPRPRPLRIDGEDVYLCLISPGQALNLIQNTYYQQRFREADRRGSQNTLMRNSLGVWNCGEESVLIKAYGRILTRTGSGGTGPSDGFRLNAARTALYNTTDDKIASGDTVARALLLGAQSCLVGYGSIDGQMFRRTKGDLDKGTNRKPFYGIDWLYGVRKSQFANEAGTAQQDFAVCCIDTHVV